MKDLVPSNNDKRPLVKQNEKELDNIKTIEAEAGKVEDKKEPSFQQEDKEKKHTWVPLLLALVGILLVVLILMFSWNRFVVDKGYETKNAQTVISEQEQQPLKADKLDPAKAYVLKGAKDTLNNMTITIEQVQFRKDQTRLWVNFKNTGGSKINMMPTSNAILIDNQGRQYKVDPFAGEQALATGIAPGVNQTQMLVFPALAADAKQVNFHLDMVFDMKNSAWQFNIPFDIP